MKESQVDTTTEKVQQKGPEKNDLIIPQYFTYEYFEINRYKIEENQQYEALCNNGFIKMYSRLCRVYWHAQNQFCHEVPDWKFHVSVKHKDLRKAWNLIVALFIKMKCRAGIKTIYLKQSQNPEPGRQITLYLIKYDQKFKESAFAGQFGLDIAIQHSEDYWFEMCKNIEQILKSYEIESNGLANGDYPLGKYVSFRNQAFVRNVNGDSIYPPNNVGWNPKKHCIPINLQRFKTISLEEEYVEPTAIRRYRTLIIVGLTILTWSLWFKMKKLPSK